MQHVGRNLRLGLLGGLFVAAVYSAIALAMYLVDGSSTRFEANGTTLPILIAGYFAGGVVGGMTAGLLSPWGRTWLGAMLIGVVVAIPFFAALIITVDGISALNDSLSTIGILALILGPAGGYGAWSGLNSNPINPD